MPAIYNEFGPFSVDWLRNLIAAGHIAPGDVDARSIHELRGDDIRDATQVHAFAGIGVWSHALRLAGWPDDDPVWTGSCPCQPFSVAGRGRGVDDERHLWPEWLRLIDECRPATIFGEQVASPAGRAWLDSVSSDLEALGYAVGAADLCAAGVGAPHVRQRLFFVAHAAGERRDGQRLQLQSWRQNEAGVEAAGRGEAVELGDTDGARAGRDAGAILGAQAQGDRERGTDGDLANVAIASGATRGFWGGAEWVACRDGKARPVEPGTFPLAHGAAGRVGRLRAYGNAIVAQVAAEFVAAFMDWWESAA